MFETFDRDDYYQICDSLAAKDEDFQLIINRYGYPPFWSRSNTFESLVHIILEQQVSLASALAALNKLKEKINKITPENLLQLSDDELRACYFSRQKTVYVRDLAAKLASGELSLFALESMNETEIRNKLKSVKGIGDWTVDIFLVFILHHIDIFPLGDLAAVNALKKLKKLDNEISRKDISLIISFWKPFRTVALMMLWHYYLEDKKPEHKKKA